jgi:hypothetical protein
MNAAPDSAHTGSAKRAIPAVDVTADVFSNILLLPCSSERRCFASTGVSPIQGNRDAKLPN